MRVAFGCYFYVISAFANGSFLHEAIYRGDSADIIKSLIRTTNSVNERNEANLWTLHVAVVANNHEACELLLDSGADTEKEDDYEATPLIYAVAGNQPRIVKLLCIKGANVEHAMGPEGKTALHIAARRNYVRVFEILMHHGEGVDLNVLDKRGSTPFMLAAENGHLDILNFYPSMEISVNAIDANGRTALIRSVITGQLNSVLRILDFLFVERNEKDFKGAAAAHYAARFGHTQILAALLNAGEDGNGNATLMNAAFVTYDRASSNSADIFFNDLESHLDRFRRSAEIVKLLIVGGGVNVNSVNNAGQTAAELALHSKNYEAHAVLIKEATRWSSPNGEKTVLPALHYAIMKSNIPDIRNLLLTEDINKRDYLDDTAIHMAVQMSSEKIVRLLMDAGCDLAAKDAWGNIPLHLVKTAEIALILLKADPNAANIPNILNELPLHVACEYERLNVVRVLAPVTANIDARNIRGRSALSIAAITGNIPISHCLLEHGAGFNLPLNTATPLHWAALYDSLDFCSLFLERGLKANAANERGDTAAHLAISTENGNMELIRSLMEHTSVNVSNRAGFTLLHTAVLSKSTNRIDLVRLLLEFGAPINAQTFDGKSALYLATFKNYPKVVRVLLDYGADTRLTSKGQTALHVAIATKSPESAKMLVDANPYLLNVSGPRSAKPVDFLMSKFRPSMTLQKSEGVKELAEAMSLLGTDIPEMSLWKWMPYMSISFANYLDRLRAPISFDRYIQSGTINFIKDYKMEDTTIAYLKHGMGTFYSFAAAYYPNLSTFLAPASHHKLSRVREECFQAVSAYEKKRDKPFYVAELRLIMTRSFLSKRGQMFERTYMDFLPEELIENVIIDVVNRGNVLGRLELVANALMLSLNDRRQFERYRPFLQRRMNRLSELILPIVRRKSPFLKRKSPTMPTV